MNANRTVFRIGGSWEASRPHWWPEDHLDLILPTTGDWKVRTPKELEAAMKEPWSCPRFVDSEAVGLSVIFAISASQ